MCGINSFRKPSDVDYKGRTSGSQAWRLARGETKITEGVSYVWKINTDDLTDNAISIKYYNALDKYECSSSSRRLHEIEHWHAGVYKMSKIFRKEERDWKMLYLATEGKYAIGYHIHNQ